MLKNAGLFKKIFANYKIAIFIGSLDKFFIKLPHLPKKLRVFINKLIPFLALIIGVIGILLSVITGFFLLITLISADFTTVFKDGLDFLLILLSTIFLLKAFKPLRQGNAVGWIYLFWTQAIELISFITRTINQDVNIFTGILSILIGLYLLFEIGQFYVYKKSPEIN